MMLTWKACQLLVAGTRKDFKLVTEGKGGIPDHEISKLREGDLILRSMNVSGGPSYHAGIYCGNEEVISFTAPSDTKWYEKIPKLLLPQQSASVIKESVTNFLNGKSYEVSRLTSGIPEDFSNLVKSEMKYNKEYNPCTNNSLHFALRLLKLSAEPLPERNSQSNGETTRASKSQIQTLQQPLVQFVANSEGPGSEALASSSHEPNTPESTVPEAEPGEPRLGAILQETDPLAVEVTDDAVKKPPVKTDEEGQSLLKPKTSESTTNEGDKTADDDVKKPPVKTDEEGQSLLKPV